MQNQNRYGGVEWRCGGVEWRSRGSGIGGQSCRVEVQRCGGVVEKGQRCMELEFQSFRAEHRGEGIRISEVQSGGGMRVRVLE